MDWMNNYLQESNSSSMEQMTEFHEHAMLIMIFIFVFISLIFMNIFINKFLNLKFFEHETLEMVWTLIPISLLMFLVFPSLQVLYMMEEIMKPMVSIKITGHQWYWSYEYENLLHTFDSFNNQSSLFRLLETDKSLILPVNTHIRLLVNSSDVIHSWTLMSSGIKMDANPGRLNSCFLFGYRSGWFFGQCSEICGVNHAFMPIKVIFSPMKDFKKWILS